MENDLRDNFHFILVRPVFLGNIGSVARVLKNFGFRNLRLVEPPRNYKDSEARRMSVGAFDLLKDSQVYPTLGEALKDITLAVGTTSGQQRDWQPVPFQSMKELASQRASEKIAIVFGDERNGLLKEELERCHRVTTIETSPEFPALNLAQAVAICAYELSQIQRKPVATAESHTTGAEDDELFGLLDTLLHEVEFSRTFNRQNVLTELRGFYQRANPTSRELSLLKGALHRINQQVKVERTKPQG